MRDGEMSRRAVTIRPMVQSKGVLVAALVSALAALVIAQAPQGTQSDGALRPRPGANREP